MPSFASEIKAIKASGPKTFNRLDPEGVEIDLKASLADALASGCTDAEIAALFDLSGQELETELSNDPALAKLWDRSRATRRYQLRRSMTEVALQGEGVCQANMLKHLAQTELAIPHKATGVGDSHLVTSFAELMVVSEDEG